MANSKEQKKQYDKIYRELHKEELRISKKVYYEANKEKISDKDKERYQANKEERKISDKEYRDTHKEEIKVYRETHKEEMAIFNKTFYEANKEEQKARIKIWQQANPEKVRARNARRRARKKGVTTLPIRDNFKDYLIKTWDNKCAYCRNLSDIWNLDHFMPLDLKGHHAEYNLVLACPPCNVRKKAKHPFEFIKKQKISFTFKPYMRFPY